MIGRSRRAALAFALGLSCLAGQVAAWGATGHRIIGRLAIETLPSDMPTFVRSAQAVESIGEAAREPDRWRGSGKVHDNERDPAHFFDLSDDGTVNAGPTLAELPPTREAYDTALRAVNTDSWKMGYLPYSIIDGWQQLAKDFAYWRADQAAAKNSVAATHRQWFIGDRQAREALILRDIGVLAHFVGDASQPMHVSTHHNGWGAGPNPRDFTQARVHVPFEGPYIRQWVTPSAVRAAMPKLADCRCLIEQAVRDYLVAGNRMIVPYFELRKTGGFEPGNPRGQAFAVERVAAGAAELRDLIAGAWRASEAAQVGWPAVAVTDILAGKLDPYTALFGED